MADEPTPEPGGEERPEETAAEALARARLHARRAAGEALAALRALADAASLASTGRPGEAHAALRGLVQVLDEQSRRLLEGDAAVPMPVVRAVLDALDHEIGRWEKRAERDPEARAVLRTFLGLREILWEFGFRRGEGNAPGARDAGPSARRRAARKRDAASEVRPDEASPSGSGARQGAGPAPPRRSRVQRVDVKG